MKFTFTIILALAAFASAQLDGQEATEDLIPDLIQDLANDAEPAEVDALVETDADESAVSPWRKIAGDKKCPYLHNHRIAKFTGQTLDSCGAQCKGNSACVGFSVKTASGALSGECMLCNSKTGLETHAGFNFYEMMATSMTLQMSKWFCGEKFGRKGGPGNCIEQDCSFQCHKERGKGWCKTYSWEPKPKFKCTLTGCKHAVHMQVGSIGSKGGHSRCSSEKTKAADQPFGNWDACGGVVCHAAYGGYCLARRHDEMAQGLPRSDFWPVFKKSECTTEA